MIETAELVTLEAAVQHALATGDESGLRVLGYGEISLVVGWPTDAPAWACKRLPPFPDRASFDRYARTVVDYIAALGAQGVDVVETEVLCAPGPDGSVAGYAVQPALAAASVLAPRVLAAADPAQGHPLVDAVITTTVGVLGPRLGFDAQLSNWVWEDDRLRYLDITTPFLFSDDGVLQMDMGLLLASLPWAMRAAVGRFVVPDVMDRFRDPRRTLVDLCGNLLKERLDAWLPRFVEAANAHVTPAITEAEVRKFYTSDARLWSVILGLRRLDRVWQRRVRRRTYPFLLPGRIDR